MATINYFSEEDLPIITIGSPSNTSCTSGASCTINVQVDSVCGAAIDTVTFDFGDGNTAVAVDGGGGDYSSSNTYAAAGIFGFKVVVTHTGTTHVNTSPLTAITVS